MTADGTTWKTQYCDSEIPGTLETPGTLYLIDGRGIVIPRIGQHGEGGVASRARNRYSVPGISVGYEDQINLYAYVGNDPVNASDPTGETAMPNVKALIPALQATFRGHNT